jgi:cytochrome c2
MGELSSAKRQLLRWSALAVVACTLLVIAVQLQQRSRAHWSVFLGGDPRTGSLLLQKKGCVHCHAVNGVGGRLAPDLGVRELPRSGLDELVSAMWNHAPRMWELMRSQNLPYPNLSREDMAHLFAYLYTATYADEPGDVLQGKKLFGDKGCIRCHALHGEGGRIGPDLSARRDLETPIAWTQAMWNHAPAMEGGLRQLDLAWPRFEGREMNDLLAYLREAGGAWGPSLTVCCFQPQGENGMLPADADHGQKLFQEKLCVECHAVSGEKKGIGPVLGPRRRLPPTFVQLAGLMWNHTPGMMKAMTVQGMPRPVFKGQEMADLIAYLYRLRYFEAIGSPQAGQQVFSTRGCSHCHGNGAEGTSQGPSLRSSSEIFTPVTLAVALWRHGPQMYQRAQELKRSWPTLEQGDVADLVVFLNTSPEGQR